MVIPLLFKWARKQTQNDTLVDLVAIESLIGECTVAPRGGIRLNQARSRREARARREPQGRGQGREPRRTASPGVPMHIGISNACLTDRGRPYDVHIYQVP